MSIKPVLSEHLPYVTIFHCSLGRSHNKGLTVFSILLLMNVSGDVYYRKKLNVCALLDIYAYNL